MERACPRLFLKAAGFFTTATNSSGTGCYARRCPARVDPVSSLVRSRYDGVLSYGSFRPAIEATVFDEENTALIKAGPVSFNVLRVALGSQEPVDRFPLSRSPRYDHPSPTGSWGSYEGSLMKKPLHTPVSSMGEMTCQNDESQTISEFH